MIWCLQPYIKTAIVFLTTRLKQTNLDEYTNMAQCIRYIRSKVKITLTLEANKDIRMMWWIDAAYRVHPYIKIHSVRTMFR